MSNTLSQLASELEGELYFDDFTKKLYATDASVYKILPLAVAIPKSKNDIKKLIQYAHTHHTSLIPRTAGTSLNGQVVGSGIVVDVSKYWNQILEVNQQEMWVKVLPGVNLDELNKHLEPLGMFFGPETSTSNRCRIGGMVGNNSCGSHSMIYGTTRDHLLEIDAILSDGTEVTFNAISKNEFEAKCNLKNLEGALYRQINDRLSTPKVQQEIKSEFPKPEIRRRNSGYAIDELLDTEIFSNDTYLTYKSEAQRTDRRFNFCKLLAGSEGTLAFTTAIKLNCVPVPPQNKGALVVHLHSIYDACKATIIAANHHPGAIELMDDFILDNAKKNTEQQKNLFFIQGSPKAVIVVEWARHTQEEIYKHIAELEVELQAAGYGYHFAKLYGSEISACWALRKAGLGLLANVPGDSKAVACIEDTAVHILDQPEYIAEFEQILKKYHKSSVYYAHIGDGEIHLRPILDLKKADDRTLFVTITSEVADLVKKYRGSLSGEHGDGIVRGHFLKRMIGEANYNLCIEIKNTWDPHNIFNPNKITQVAEIDKNLRYTSGQVTKEIETYFDFSATEGIIRMAEKCNGAGDCLKSHHIGGTMCPSYMATRNEKDSTRGRANILREILTQSSKKNPFDHPDIKQAMDLCLSCKGCKNECNSNVDVAMLKAEFLQHYYDANGVPFRTLMIGNFVRSMQIASHIPALYNTFMTWKPTSAMANAIMGIHPKRKFPLLHPYTLQHWYKKNIKPKPANSPHTVYLFCDEFTNYNDVEIGIKTLKLLTKLGYNVIIPSHHESGRTFLSKGMVRQAQTLANKNVEILSGIVNANTPLIGIEPSAILGFRDEYPLLVSRDNVPKAQTLAKYCMTTDEFLAKEIETGNIEKSKIASAPLQIKLHGHCHQKALSTVVHSKKLLEYAGHKVELIPSGCCGMAGSFGYEKEHYQVSMQIGELVLFPTIRKSTGYEIVASGTSCRHQIYDGTGKKAKHIVEVLANNE